MEARRFALWGGLVMLILGIVSLIPPFKGGLDSLPELNVEASYGLFLGLFPMNIINKLALILFGAAGVMVQSSARSSVLYARVVFYVMGAATVLGMIPLTNTFFGYWPLFNGEIVAHGVFALLGAYFGYAYSTRQAPRARAA